MNDITQKYLRSVLRYNQDTGVFTWLISVGPRKAGSVAGTLRNGYIIIGVNNKLYRAHRLAWLYMTGAWPKDQIDHINMLRSDNRINNLRLCNNSENMRNRPKQKNNTSGYKGVSWFDDTKKWQAKIELNKKQTHLGLYEDRHEAARAYNEAALRLFGEFALLNIIEER